MAVTVGQNPSVVVVAASAAVESRSAVHRMAAAVVESLLVGTAWPAAAAGTVAVGTRFAVPSAADFARSSRRSRSNLPGSISLELADWAVSVAEPKERLRG